MTTDKLGDGEVVLFQAEDGKTRLEVRLDHETVWRISRSLAVFSRRRCSWMV